MNKIIANIKGYILVIAEKPRSAEKIAHALGNPKKYRINGVPIWFVTRNNMRFVIAPAAGHLYTLHTESKGFPVFDYKWVPRYTIDPKSTFTRRYISVLSMLAKNAKEYINACDYDIEGSLIGYMIIKNIGDIKKSRRAKFSSLTASEIIKAFDNLSPLDYNMIEAGYCRHVLDWLWGINISRMLMKIYKDVLNERKILSAGRVQSPTLFYVVSIDLQRKSYVPIPYGYPSIKVVINNKVFKLIPVEGSFNSLSDAKEYLKKVKYDPRATVSDIIIKDERIAPPHPFNLPDLQSEAYRVYGFTPYKTQKLAEDLYLEALISYPRTNSQKLPPTLNNREILEKLAQNSIYRDMVKSLLTEVRGMLKPNNGPKEDPAHPAIYPTGEGSLRSLSKDHAKLYDLIVRRYFATFANPALIRYIRIEFIIHGRHYYLSTNIVRSRGWLYYYPYIRFNEEAISIDSIRKGLQVPIHEAKIVIYFTKPPRLSSKLSLIKWMEEKGIGTEATRAEIVETLFKRGYLYIKGGSINVSELGILISFLLKDYVEELISVELTRKFEDKLNMILDMKAKCDDIVVEAKEVLLDYINRVKKLNIQELKMEVSKYIEMPNNNNRGCIICRRSAYTGNLCVFHSIALENIKNTYESWRRFGFNWIQYLEKLLKLKGTGSYVKEVCKHLISNKMDF